MERLQELRLIVQKKEQTCTYVHPILTIAGEPYADGINALLKVNDRALGKQQSAKDAFDESIADVVPKRMATRICDAWCTTAANTLKIESSVQSVLNSHHFSRFIFVFEAMCFATFSKTGIEQIVKLTTETDGLVNFPQMVNPIDEATGKITGWASEDWLIFCAIAEAAARFFHCGSGQKQYDTFLSDHGSVVAITHDGQLKIDHDRREKVRPVVEKYLEDLALVYGSTKPESLSDLHPVLGQSNHAFRLCMGTWLGWSDSAVATLLCNDSTKRGALPEPHKSPGKFLESYDVPADRSSEASIVFETAKKRQLSELVKMSALRLRVQKCRRRGAEEAEDDCPMAASDLFGSDTDDD